MHYSSLKRIVCVVMALLAVGMGSDAASAQLAAVASKLPGGANAVLAIDVSKFLQSELGKKMELQSKLVSGYADRPLAVPATAKRVAIGAAVHPAGMRSIWEAAVIELSGPPRLEPMLQKQGGFLDRIEGKNAAWTPRDVFYIAMDGNTLAVARPGQRQLVRRWMAGQVDKTLPPYISNAMTAAGDAHAVFAVDLDGAVSLAAVRYALGMGQLPSLEKIETGRDKLMSAIAAVEGMTLTMRVTDKIDAEWVIDFDQNVSALGSHAKEFVIDVLTAADLYEGGAERWDFKAEGNRLIGKGTMETEALNGLIALLSPVHMSDADMAAGHAAASNDSTGAPRPAAADDPQKQAAVASQKYYQAISKALDSISAKPSPQQGATWLRGQARNIQKLPVLNVDPALLDWGNAVSEAFMRAAEELNIGQQKAMIASQGIETPVGYASYSESGEYGGDTPESRAAFKNAARQRRQVSQAERLAAAERAFAVFDQVMPMRGQIRIQMTQKYGVEF